MLNFSAFKNKPIKSTATSLNFDAFKPKTTQTSSIWANPFTEGRKGLKPLNMSAFQPKKETLKTKLPFATTHLGIAINTILGMPKAAKDILMPTRGYTEEELKKARPTIKETALSVPKIVAEIATIGELASGLKPLQRISETQIGEQLADVGDWIKKFAKPKTVGEASAMRLVDALLVIPVGSIKAGTSAAGMIARSKNYKTIGKILIKENPKLKPQTIDVISKVFTNVDNVDDVQRTLNKINFAMNEAKSAKAGKSLTVIDKAKLPVIPKIELPILKLTSAISKIPKEPVIPKPTIYKKVEVPFTKLNEIVAKLKTREKTRELFDQARLEFELASETIEANPAKQLVKYTNKTTGRLPEVLGYGKSKFAREGDQLITELGFEYPEQAEEALRKYLIDKEKLNALEDNIRAIRGEVVDIKKGEVLVKRAFKDRRSEIRAVQHTYQLTSQEVAHIRRGRDITAMTKRDFANFVQELESKGYKEFRRSEALVQLKATIWEKELDVENLRKAMKLPSIKNMTTDQLNKLDEALQPFQQGDEFLSVRKLEVVDRTELKGIKTWREARERLAKKLGVPIEKLQNIKVSEFDRFRYDTGLAERNDFYKMMVEEPAKRLLVSETEYLKIEKEVFDLAKTIKPKGIIERLIPQQKRIMEYMEAKPEVAKTMDLTVAEKELANFMAKHFSANRDYLIQMEAMKMGKENYFVHIRRGILEAVKEDGIVKAVKEVFTQYKLDEQNFDILDKATGEILAMNKFFRFSMHRTGELKPTENVIKAFLTYQKMFLKKQALDEIVPLIDIYAHALTPKGLTEKGVLLHGNLIKFTKEWLNTQKGRHITLIAKQSGKIDGALRTIKMFTSLRDLGLNMAVSVATEVGEQITTYQLLGKKLYALGKIRQNTKQGKVIIEKYRNLIGKNPWKELIEPSKDIGNRLMEGIFIMFRDSAERANRTFILGSLSKQEFQAGIISPERLTALRTELGRYRMVEGMKSIIGATPEGKSYTQYKKWAIPILRTTIKNLGNIGKKITRQKVGSEEWKKSVIELYRFVEITAFMMLAFSLVKEREKEKDFVGRIITKAHREATTLVQALSPAMFLTVGRTGNFIEELGDNLTLILKGEESKGTKKLKKQFTPVAVSQFPEKEEGITIPSISIPSIKIPSIKIPSISI